MINIVSIKCSLVFAPYLADAFAEYLGGGPVASRVIRQGGAGLIIRADRDLVLRHEDRQVTLESDDVQHYCATIRMRNEFYNISRMEDEVVLATLGDELLLSHPQSQLWLTREMVAGLERVFANPSPAEEGLSGIPEWLKVSTGGGRLLLSDQRSGRWVLLGDDHIRELKSRLSALCQPATSVGPEPPTILLKGLTIHLQSALKLSSTLAGFADSGQFTPFEEITPSYSLKASKCTEGIELRDLENRVALTAREARKWAAIILDELERLNAHHVERGGIRTVFVNGDGGRWVLQWGDRVFVPSGRRLEVECGVISKRAEGFLVLLNHGSGACVALNDGESRHLEESHVMQTGTLIEAPRPRD